MWVTIETVLGNGRRYILDMESDGLYKLNPNWTGNILEFKDYICKMIVTDDLLIVRTEDRDFRDCSQSASWIKDKREINNVDAYDHNGNHLWNIGKIIGDIKMQHGKTVKSAKLPLTNPILYYNIMIATANTTKFLFCCVRRVQGYKVRCRSLTLPDGENLQWRLLYATIFRLPTDPA